MYHCNVFYFECSKMFKLYAYIFFSLDFVSCWTKFIEVVQQIIKQEMPPSGYDVINIIAY